MHVYDKMRHKYAVRKYRAAQLKMWAKAVD